jgi:microcystin-dependent protein
MSAELAALEDLAANFRAAWFRLSATSQAVLFYATPYLTARFNWIDRNTPLDTVSDSDWDTIENYVDTLLYEAKNPMIGLIIPFVTSDPPPNILPCDGSTYLRVDYPILYDVLDSHFITDADHFIVPDLRGRTVIGAGLGSGLTTRNVADTGGEEAHQLTESELASHTHTIPATITTLVVEPGEVTALTPVPIVTANTGSTGGDTAHENMQPFFALNYGVIAS